MNNNIDEELKKKIEKREKFDMMLAYVLIGVLLLCMVLVLFSKFGRKSNLETEVKPNYISASEITSTLNNSNFVKNEINGGAILKATNIDNAIVVNYIKDNINLNYSISLVGSELKFDYINLKNADEKNFIDNLYKEIAIIICKYYGNNEESCRDVINNVNENSNLDGIRFTKIENNNIVYVNARKSVPVVNKIIYNGNQNIDINSDDYILNIKNYQIKDTMVTLNDEKFVLNGIIDNINNKNSNIKIILNLFDNSNNIIGTSMYELKDLQNVNYFNITINYNNFNKEDIVSYSFDIE